jgi:multisubunit Na+/H+ antiporter MnhE subunit
METKQLILLNKETIIGFVLGFLVAVLCTTLLLRYYAGERFWELYHHPAEWPIMGAVLSLGSLPNLALFFYFLRINKEYKAKGVLSAVVFIAVAVLIIKLSSL